MNKHDEKKHFKKTTNFLIDYIRYISTHKYNNRLSIEKLMEQTSYQRTALFDFKSGARKPPIDFFDEICSICNLAFNNDPKIFEDESKDIDTFVQHYFDLNSEECNRIINNKMKILNNLYCSYAWEIALFYKFYALILDNKPSELITITKYIVSNNNISSAIALLVYSIYQDFRIHNYKYNLPDINYSINLESSDFMVSSDLTQAVFYYYCAINSYLNNTYENNASMKPSQFFLQHGFTAFYIKVRTFDCNLMLSKLDIDGAIFNLLSLKKFEIHETPKFLQIVISTNLAFAYFLKGDHLAADEVFNSSYTNRTSEEFQLYQAFVELFQSNSVSDFTRYLKRLEPLTINNILQQQLINAMLNNNIGTIQSLMLDIKSLNLRKDLLLTNFIILQKYLKLTEHHELRGILENYIFLLQQSN